MSVDQNKPVPRWQAGDWFFRSAVPLYIASGALMKLLTGQPLQLPLVSLIHDPSDQVERWARAALPVLCAVELTLAGAILLGGRWSRWLALATLLAFAAVLMPHVSAAAASCGCFGAVQTSPTLMLVTALVGAALIVLLPCTGKPLFQSSPRRVVPWALCSVLLCAAIYLTQLPERAGWRVPVMRLVSRNWLGQRLVDLPFYPALETDGSERASPPFPESEQTWVLWLRTCPHCHEYFRERWGEPAPPPARVVAVEVPRSAAGVSAEPHAIECPSCVRLRLRKGTFYLPPETPIVLTVKDGVVVSAEINPAPSTPSSPGSTLDPQEQP